MKKITVNGEENIWRMLHISYEDVCKMAYEGIVSNGYTCVYHIPGELGGSLKLGDKTLCVDGMDFTIVYTGNA